MKYRVYYSHCGDAPTTDIFNAETDELAIKEFDRRRSDPHNGMDHMWMVRIDVEEQTTFMKH